MTTYYDLHEFIKTRLDLQSFIREIINTDIVTSDFEVKNCKTGLALVTIEPSESLDNHILYSVRIEVLDKVDIKNVANDDNYTGGTNVIDVYNTTLASLRKLYANIKEMVIGDSKYELDGNPTFEKINDEMMTFRGFAMDMNIRVDDDLTNVCINE